MKNLSELITEAKQVDYSNIDDFAKNIVELLWAWYDKKVMKKNNKKSELEKYINTLAHIQTDSQKYDDIHAQLYDMYGTSTVNAKVNNVYAPSGRLLGAISYAITGGKATTFNDKNTIKENLDKALQGIVEITEAYENYISEVNKIKQKYMKQFK